MDALLPLYNRLPSAIVNRHILPYAPCGGVDTRAIQDEQWRRRSWGIARALLRDPLMRAAIRRHMATFDFQGRYPYEFAHDRLFLTIFFRKTRDDYILIHTS